MNGRLLDECGEANGYKMKDSDTQSIRKSTAGPVCFCLTWKVMFCVKGENKKSRFHENRLTDENRNRRIKAHTIKRENVRVSKLEGTS